MKRWAKEFNDPLVTKRLYLSFVRPILEYGSIIWNPNQMNLSNRIESVQKQFLLFALRHMNWGSRFLLPSYDDRLKIMNLPSLKDRRQLLSITFIIKLINGAIDSQDLMGNLTFNVPARPSRSYNPLKLTVSFRNYEQYNPFRMCCKLFNDNFKFFDYCKPLHVIRKDIQNSL